jgi:hypothetical protein
MLKALGTTIRFYVCKRVLAKPPFTNPNKAQTVFVQIHQNSGLVNVMLHDTINTKDLMTHKKEMGNIRITGN